jgi:hypothetical protein
MKRFLPLAAALLLPALAHGFFQKPDPIRIFTYDFSRSDQGWTAGFADYPFGSGTFYEFEQGLRPLPPGLLPGRRLGFFLGGSNHSDDLCMYLRKKVTGLRPKTAYEVRFHLTFASDAPNGAAGIGGAPGESVYVKAGVVRQRPTSLVSNTKRVYLNLRKGNQANPGRDALVLGNVGVDLPEGESGYKLKTLTNQNRPFTFVTDATGSVWLFVGTDSGFEGITRIYFTRIEARFKISN